MRYLKSMIYTLWYLVSVLGGGILFDMYLDYVGSKIGEFNVIYPVGLIFFLFNTFLLVMFWISALLNKSFKELFKF